MLWLLELWRYKGSPQANAVNIPALLGCEDRHKTLIRNILRHNTIYLSMLYTTSKILKCLLYIYLRETFHFWKNFFIIASRLLKFYTCMWNVNRNTFWSCILLIGVIVFYLCFLVYTCKYINFLNFENRMISLLESAYNFLKWVSQRICLLCLSL